MVQRGKRTVRRDLFFDVVHVLVSQPIHRGGYRSHAHAVQRGIHHTDIPRIVQGQFRQDADVPLVQIRADGLDQTAADAVIEVDPPDLGDTTHFSRDVFIQGRYHLSAVGSVYLESIIARWIMAGTDHHACCRP